MADILQNEILMPLLCRPGTLVDVGANFGQSAAALLRVADSRVVAFEPVTQTFLGLCTLLSRGNGGKLPERLSVYNLAIGSGVATTRISIPYFEGVRWEGRASMAQDFQALADRTQSVAITHVEQDIVTVPLDLFAFPDVTFLKIDVEGFEKEVLEGAARTIARCRPVIHIEIEELHRPGATREVPALLAGHGYHGFFFANRVLHEFKDFDAAEFQPPAPLPKSGMPAPSIYVNEFIFVHHQDAWALGRLAEIVQHLIAGGNLQA